MKLKTKTLFAALAVLFMAVSVGTAFGEQPDKWVRYVEATGSQYVDTGVQARWGTKAEMKVEWLAFADASFLAARNSGDTRLYFCHCYPESAYPRMLTALRDYKYLAYGGWFCCYETNRVYSIVSELTSPDANNMVTNIVTVDGLQMSFMDGSANPVSMVREKLDVGRSLYLFACNNNGSAVYQSKTRCYSLKIWQDGNLVRDFQPCMKDNRAGLYDAVSETIFYSGSSADLVCDPDSEVPDEYIDYVESQGESANGDGLYSAYLDTGVIGRSGTKMTGEFAFLGNGDEAMLDARADDGDTRFFMLHCVSDGQAPKLGYGYGAYYWQNAIVLGQRYLVETERNVGLQTMKVNGETIVSEHNVAELDTRRTLYLFACNYGGAIRHSCKGRCYGLKIWQDGVLVRDFRPCLKNGVAGLYDDVSKRIHYSASTPFAYESKRTVKEKNLIFVEYIESDGCNTLDTGVSARSGTRAAGEMAWMGPSSDGSPTNLRDYYQEMDRYLETSLAVFYRDRRAYLASLSSETGGKFSMVHSYDRCLEAGYGTGGYLEMKSGGAKIAPTIGAKCSFDVTLENGSQTIEWNGTQVLSTNIIGTVDTGDTLHLFSSSYWRYRSAARCYGLKIWQDGNLVRDFKPCIYENKGMLYDTVTKCVYRPSPDIPVSRTGSIILTGDEKPAQYVEYVESDGTIFVDTGIIGKSGTATSLKMRSYQSGDGAFLDARKGDARFYLWHTYWTEFLYGYGGYYVFGTCAQNTDYEVYSSLASGSQTISVNGVQLINATAVDTIDTGLTLYVFGMNHDGAVDYKSAGRLYWLKLYQGNADGSSMRLVRDFKPVRLKNGLVVLWDFVEDKPYPAQSVTAPYNNTFFSAVGPDGEEIKLGTAIVIR